MNTKLLVKLVASVVGIFIFVGIASSKPENTPEVKSAFVENLPTLTTNTLPVIANTPTSSTKPVASFIPVEISNPTTEPTTHRRVSSSAESMQTTNSIGGSSSYTCNCSKTCSNMSCSEAQYQLKICGCGARDADKDGVACDSQCQ